MAQQNSEEIDLGYLLKKSGDFFKSLLRAFFKVVDFFVKFYIFIIALIIVGFIYGYYKDSNAVKSYNNELIVIPNFESVDYLYDKVEAINTKISMGDSIYLKRILDTNFRKLGSIKIEPIVDIYNFVSKSRENIDIFRIIAEKQDFAEYVDDMSNSRYYKYHKLSVSTVGKTSSETIINKLLFYINENEHLKNYKKIYQETKDFEIQEHYEMINQIDSIFKNDDSKINSASSIEVVTNNDQHFLIEKKEEILEKIVNLKVEQLDYTEPVKLVNADYNLKKERFLNISNKVKYPFLLVFFFSLIFFVIYVFKKMRTYSKKN
ncbi:hypothetical protein [Aequorivita echinoideorum]|uniref:Chain length determinant protein n=1 Tax=Aequorivita echinoideorum TaxID=1549647 RepID=A0ABS5S1S9_9FLAO|nr:hypothetical protein [Aequorivita echinoideorum]MBT0607151.1 hypothetical protein [Aequorivita echinoideorum]